MRFLFVLGALVTAAVSAQAQDTVYGTSGMDRGQAGQARLQAQQAAMMQNLQNVAACGNSGRLYGPAFGGPRAGNCPSALTLQSSGGVAITGGATISGNSSFANNVTVGGTLTVGGRITVSAGGIAVTGNSTFANAVSITGNTTVGGTLTSTNRIFADNGVHVRSEWLRINGNNGVLFNNHGGGWHMSDSTWIRAYGDKSIFTTQNVRANGQFQIGTSVFGPPPSCNVNTQKLHWNNGWSCQTLIGSTGAGEQDPSVGTLTNNSWCRAQGGQIQCNIAPAPSCNATSQKLRWTGSAWECVTDNTWAQLTGVPVTASRWPAWNEVTSRPAHANAGPPVCTGSGKALQWNGSAWLCGTIETAPPAPACSGTLHAGFCWYAGGLGQSCSAVCASRGGPNIIGIRDYVGHQGSLSNCVSVASALGMTLGEPMDSNNCNSGLQFTGCTEFTSIFGTRITRCINGATTSEASLTGARRICACNN